METLLMENQTLRTHRDSTMVDHMTNGIDEETQDSETELIQIRQIRPQIRPSSSETDPDHIRHFSSGPVLAKHNWPGSDLVLGGHVRLWPKGSRPEASRCAARFRPTASGMFTG